MGKAWKALGEHHEQYLQWWKLSEVPGGRVIRRDRQSVHNFFNFKFRYGKLYRPQASVQGKCDKICCGLLRRLNTGAWLSTWCKDLFLGARTRSGACDTSRKCKK